MSTTRRAAVSAEMVSREPVMRARHRPQRAGGDATRRRLLDAGRITFARDGLAGSSVQAILDSAAVSAPVLYHHFGSKTGLFLAVAEAVYERFVEALHAATATVEGFDEAIDAAIDAAARLHAADPSLAPMAIEVQVAARRNAALRQELSPTLGSFRAFAENLAARADADVREAAGLRALTLAVIVLLNGLSSLAVTLHDPAEFADAAAALRVLVARTRRSVDSAT